MEPMWIVIVVALIAVAAVAAVALVRTQTLAAQTVRVAGTMQEMLGRIGQMSENNAAAQAELRKTLDERLDAVSKRLGDSLSESATKTHQTIADLRERLAKIDAAQQNIAELSGQVVSLQEVLTNKQARGAFGEIQLNDLVTKVLPPSAYRFQETLGNNNRCDCLLLLPNPPGPIVIDAKFPLESYHALQSADDDAARTAAARAFRQAMQTHIDAIATKYIVAGETAESAFMFLPSEAVYAELHANFPDVVEKSYRAKVFVVSPTTLWAVLNTVRAVMKDVRMREQAGVIQKEVLTLLEDVARLDDRVGKLQRHFEQATEDVRQIRISTDKVARRGQRIEEIEFEDDSEAEEIAGPRLVDPGTRSAGGAEG